jgi:hypothetical protein
MTEPVMAWHWVARNEKGVLKLRNGRNVPPVGVPLEHKGGEAWRVARAASAATAGQENKLLSMLKEAGWDGV